MHQQQQISSPFRQLNDHSKLHHNQQFKPSFPAINLEPESTDSSDLSSPTFHNEDNENNFDSTDDAPDYADDLNDEEDTK